MTDVTYNSAEVKVANANTVKASGTSGAAITAGQPVYADPTVSYKIKPAKADDEEHTANLVGVALNSTPGTDQPIVYATQGDVLYDDTSAVFVVGQVYAVSDNTAGGIEPFADIATNSYVGILGVAIDNKTLRVSLIPTSTAKA